MAANLEVFDKLFRDLRIIGFPQELGERELLVDRTVRFEAEETIRFWVKWQIQQ